MSRRERLQKMLVSEPKDVFLNSSLAMEYVKAGQHAEAPAQFGRVIELDGDYVAAYSQQAGSLIAMEHGDRLKATHALDICRAALMLDAVDVPHGWEEMVRAALSTYSLPQALGNLANKLLLDTYDEAPATWRSFCAVRSVADFKPHTAIRPSFTGQLEPVAPGGELEHGQAGEWYTQFQADWIRTSNPNPKTVFSTAPERVCDEFLVQFLVT